MNSPAPADQSYFARHSAALAWLALCPLLAASTSPAAAFGLGVAACAVFGLGGLMATALGRRLPLEVRVVALTMLVAALAMAVVRCLAVWQPEAQDALGRDGALITAAGVLIVAADTSSWSIPGQGLLARMIAAGLVGLAALLVIGAIRALAAHGMQLAQRPAGGFVLLGLLLAAACAMRNRATSTHLDSR